MQVWYQQVVVSILLSMPPWPLQFSLKKTSKLRKCQKKYFKEMQTWPFFFEAKPTFDDFWIQDQCFGDIFRQYLE